MAKRSLIDQLAIKRAVDPVIAADADGITIDTKGYDSALFVAHIGIEGDTLSGSVKIEFELEDSPDGTTWTDVDAAELSGTVSGDTWVVIDADAEAPAIHAVSYIGAKRYVRAVVNITGTHTVGTPVSVCCILGHAHIEPTDDPGAPAVS